MHFDPSQTATGKFSFSDEVQDFFMFGDRHPGKAHNKPNSSS